MIIEYIEDFYQAIIKLDSPNLISIDYGSKKSGIAISSGLNISFPYTKLQHSNNKVLLQKIMEIIFLKKVSAIVIGLPFLPDSSDSIQTSTTRKFASILNSKSGLPIYLQDERFTTIGAHRYLQSFGFSRKERSHISDEVSANLILEIVLEKCRTLSGR